ncbi:MAG: choice-of-anchor D domain-containing protein, partial [Roseiflexaceae bacterium]
VPAGFSVPASFGTTTVAPNSATTFQVRLDAVSAGAFSGTVQFANRDADENPFNFTISGSVTKPEIQVSVGGSNVADGTGAVHFGTTEVGSPVTKTFTISNTGTANLTLTPPISVPAGFSVPASFGTTTVAPNSATTFQVRLDASTVGIFSGTVQFTNNDADEGTFTFTVTGTVELAERRVYLPLVSK